MLKRWGGREVWIETGTYSGSTTRKLLRFSKKVITIEPSAELHREALRRLRKFKKVELIHGLSEAHLDAVTASLARNGAKDISFWLDGHYSGGITVRGESDTPIVHELETIARYRGVFTSISVFIDDVRCFNPSVDEFRTYPNLSFLTTWSESNRLFWTIEHDIFVATTRREPILRDPLACTRMLKQLKVAIGARLLTRFDSLRQIPDD